MFYSYYLFVTIIFYLISILSVCRLLSASVECLKCKNIDRDHVFDPFLSVCPPAENLRNRISGNIQKGWSWGKTWLTSRENLTCGTDTSWRFLSTSVQWVSSSSACISFMSLKSFFYYKSTTLPLYSSSISFCTCVLFPNSQNW